MDSALLEMGPIIFSRWQTLPCKILQFHVPTNHPSNTLATIAKLCMQVYFQSWFQTKLKIKVADGTKILTSSTKESTAILIFKFEAWPFKLLIEMLTLLTRKYFASNAS